MSTLRTITAFKSKLSGGGARPNLFEVEIPSFPESAGSNTWRTGDNQEADTFKFLCKAAQLPASNLTPVEIPFRGRILKVAGDRTFDTWTITVINDENFLIRNAFETWIQSMGKNSNATGATDPNSYMTYALVHQLGRGADVGPSASGASESINGTAITPLKTYTFFDIFPTTISAIDLSYENADAIEEYTVDFQVQYWEPGAYTRDSLT
tara:strand:+ start:2452 stop:3081 length:630 start_codon:yes stop_codon:yes gene_type:complete